MARKPAGDGAQNEAPGIGLLEAHYFHAGLHTKPLGSDFARPEWAPPSDYAGFRNELPLERGDAAVEFARYAYRGHRVTWLGVFHRSVDQVFGDRQNYAGAGVWILEADVVHAGNLLASLDQFAQEVAAGKIETICRDADNFLVAPYLPAYLRPSANLPGPLAGWP